MKSGVVTALKAGTTTIAYATSTSGNVNSKVITDEAAALAADVAINTAAIAGVIAPVTGATPVVTATETAEYTATIAWNEAPTTFAGNTAYTATITITPKAGYTLSGVAANQFTVSGATATDVVNLGVVTAVFPATAALSATADVNLALTTPIARMRVTNCS